MFNKDVENLYEKVKINTPIWMGSETLLESYGVKFKSNYKESETVEEEKVEAKEINIQLDGEKIRLNNPIINRNGTTYYPFREILELINAEVIWDSENERVIGILGENYVEFKLNNNEYINNGISKSLPEGQNAFSDEGKTYIPIRNLMESLGYDVYWEQSTSTIVIISSFTES